MAVPFYPLSSSRSPADLAVVPYVDYEHRMHGHHSLCTWSSLTMMWTKIQFFQAIILNWYCIALNDPWPLFETTARLMSLILELIHAPFQSLDGARTNC